MTVHYLTLPEMNEMLAKIHLNFDSMEKLVRQF